MKQLTADKTGFISLCAWMDTEFDVTGLNFTKQVVYTMCNSGASEQNLVNRSRTQRFAPNSHTDSHVV